jgi:hypothetical protein
LSQLQLIGRTGKTFLDNKPRHLESPVSVAQLQQKQQQDAFVKSKIAPTNKRPPSKAFLHIFGQHGVVCIFLWTKGMVGKMITKKNILWIHYQGWSRNRSRLQSNDRLT